MSRASKKEKFTQTGKNSTGLYVIVGLVVFAVLAVGAFMFTGDSADAGLENVGSVNYTGKNLEFAKVQAEEADGKIIVDFNEIKNNKSVTFDVQGINFALANGTPFNYLPLLAYVTPKGNVVVATSICEPCSGIYFHIEGEELVCNACDTRWDLETLQGISGGCPQYPPDKVKYSIEGDKLIIEKSELASWQPRAI